MRAFAVLLLIGLVWYPRAAMACATCYGTADAPQTHAMNAAIFSLLGVIAAVLSLFATFFVYLMVRARSTAMDNSAALGIGQREYRSTARGERP